MKKLILLAILTFSLSGFAQIPYYVPTNGLVAWYPFNGNVNDLSGNNLNGINNGATLTTDRLGNANSSYSFNGSSNYITIPNTNKISGLNKFTIGMWIKASQNITQMFFINSNGYNGTDNGFLVRIWSGNYIFEIGNGTIWKQVVISNSADYLNKWTYLLMTYDSLTMNFYINNSLKGTNSYSLDIKNTTANYAIGYYPGYSQYFKGLIDDIGIWNRALTIKEISALFLGCYISINSQPSDTTVIVGNSIEFAISCSSTTATYQWQTDLGLGLGYQNITNSGQFSGATNDILTVSNVSLSNNNQKFRCLVTDGNCKDTSHVATLKVTPCQLVINSQPINFTVKSGNTAKFLVSTNSTKATYQWQTDIGLGFQNISNAGQYSGATNDTLTISNVSLSNNNQIFRCIVVEGPCNDTSNVVSLIVNPNSINNKQFEKQISIYPNPTNNEIIITSKGDFENNEYTITNQFGQILFTGYLDRTNSKINLENLSDGIYFLNVFGYARQTIKIIKE